jgi:hypothetical protein
MRRLARMLGRLGFAVVVLGALAFGATQALSGSSRRDDCQPCASTKECDRCCHDVLGFDGGDCYPPNCLCY